MPTELYTINQNISFEPSWKELFFNQTKELIKNGTTPYEDQRCADWIYLLPSHKRECALLFGAGFGTIATTLSLFFEKVYVVDTNEDKINFLKKRINEEAIGNVFSHLIKNWEDKLPLDSFDLIACPDLETVFPFEIDLKLLIKNMSNSLNTNGTLYLCGFNAWGPYYLRNKIKKNRQIKSYNYFSFKKILRKYGLNDISIYSPLPIHKGIPLFTLCTSNKKAFRFFFKKIFPLFEMVSPESKKAYAFEYHIAKIISKIALKLKLTWVSKYFLPSFSIFASRTL